MFLANQPSAWAGAGGADQPLWSDTRPWKDNLLATAAAALPWALRLHLALFYLHGTYYQWPKRLTGAT